MTKKTTPDFTKTNLHDFLKSTLYSPDTQLDVSLRYHKGEWRDQLMKESSTGGAAAAASLFAIRGHQVLLDAARHGNADAQNAYGELKWHGNNMNPNLEEAVVWFGKAADQKHPEAKKNLARAVSLNLGMPKAPAQKQIAKQLLSGYRHS